MSEVFSLGYVFKKRALNKTTDELKLVAYFFSVLFLVNFVLPLQTIMKFFSNVNNYAAWHLARCMLWLCR